MSYSVSNEGKGANEVESFSKRRRSPSAAAPDPYAQIRQLIWLYVILWLIEGGLRRWFLPGLATPLLLVRDPLVVLIYVMAAARGVFPLNGFIIGWLVLAVLTFANALIIGHGNPAVAIYGVRCDFLHVPLIFIMGSVLRQENLLRMAKVAVWVAIPYTMLLVAQFNAPQDAWVNRGLGGSLEGAGFIGALEKFRPPGTFSFITGPSALYPLFAACWFMVLMERKAPAWLLLAGGAAIMIAIPVSISRGLFLAVLIVAATGVIILFVGGRLSGGMIIRSILAALLIPLLAGQFGVFKEGMEAFSARWQDSTTDAGGVQKAIVERVVDGFTGPFKGGAFFGAGTGFSTNVGQKTLSGEVGFGGSEGEWGRLIYDNGIALGILVILFRIALATTILVASLRSWRRGSPNGLIFTSAAFMLVLTGQWGQATGQGAATIAGGLALAAAEELEGKKKKRGRKPEDGGRRTERVDRKTEADTTEAPFAVSAQPTITERKSEVSGQ